MPSIFRAFLAISAACLLVVGCGSDPSGSGGPGGDEHSLGWGMDLADGVRDSELPNGELFYIACIDVNEEGEPETNIPWQFYYAVPSDSTNLLIVVVQYNGMTTHYWETETALPLVSLPDYDDAGPWLTAVSDTLGAEFDDWEEYALMVKGNDYPEYPQVLNVAIIQYMSPDTTEQLTAIVNADNDTFLGYVGSP